MRRLIHFRTSLSPVSRREHRSVDTTTAALTIDGAALLSRGIESVTINGETRVLEDGSLQVGTQTRKPRAVWPFNQVLEKPFLAYAEDENGVFESYVVFISTWSVITMVKRGNTVFRADRRGQSTTQCRVYWCAIDRYPEAVPTLRVRESFQIGNGPQSTGAMVLYILARAAVFTGASCDEGQERSVSLPAFRFSVQCTRLFHLGAAETALIFFE